MKSFSSACLCLVLVCLGFVSCGKRIEMEESKVYHFTEVDLSLAVPKNWQVDAAISDLNKGYVKSVFIQGATYKDAKEIVLPFYIVLANSISDYFIPEIYDQQKCKKYGEYFIYIPSLKSVEQTIFDRIAVVYVSKKPIFVLQFDNFPNNEVTPELEAIFNSFKIEKTKTNSSNKDI